ncbi:MAG: hypothetical protein LBM66_04300 [Bifidobacteriaceae bacterium]|jgi:hypothetical protein|nr:hypothetical protein [Bifidobacteriaceae bacterium]
MVHLLTSADVRGWRIRPPAFVTRVAMIPILAGLSLALHRSDATFAQSLPDVLSRALIAFGWPIALYAPRSGFTLYGLGALIMGWWPPLDHQGSSLLAQILSILCLLTVLEDLWSRRHERRRALAFSDWAANPLWPAARAALARRYQLATPFRAIAVASLIGTIIAFLVNHQRIAFNTTIATLRAALLMVTLAMVGAVFTVETAQMARRRIARPNVPVVRADLVRLARNHPETCYLCPVDSPKAVLTLSLELIAEDGRTLWDPLLHEFAVYTGASWDLLGLRWLQAAEDHTVGPPFGDVVPEANENRIRATVYGMRGTNDVVIVGIGSMLFLGSGLTHDPSLWRRHGWRRSRAGHRPVLELPGEPLPIVV